MLVIHHNKHFAIFIFVKALLENAVAISVCLESFLYWCIQGLLNP